MTTDFSSAHVFGRDSFELPPPAMTVAAVDSVPTAAVFVVAADVDREGPLQLLLVLLLHDKELLSRFVGLLFIAFLVVWL